MVIADYYMIITETNSITQRGEAFKKWHAPVLNTSGALWESLWTERPGGLHSMGLRSIRHGRATSLSCPELWSLSPQLRATAFPCLSFLPLHPGLEGIPRQKVRTVIGLASFAFPLQNHRPCSSLSNLWKPLLKMYLSLFMAEGLLWCPLSSVCISVSWVGLWVPYT